MTWRYPEWFALILLTLAAFRCYRLIAADTITSRWRSYVTGYEDNGQMVGSMTPPWRRRGHGKPTVREPHRELRTFLACRWCSGWWIGFAWWAAWLWHPAATLTISIPFAISAISALISKNLDAE